MKSSFANHGSAVQSKPVEAEVLAETNTVPAAQTSEAIVPRDDASPAPYFRDDADDLDSSDVILPKVHIVQKVGDLSTVFPGGAIVLDKSAVMYETITKNAQGEVSKPQTAPLKMIVVGFGPTKYTEKVPGGGLGKQVLTVAEVLEAGGTVNYNEAKATGKRLFEQTETALVLIEKPAILEKDTSSFPYPAGGKFYAAAQWQMKGTSYTHGAKQIQSVRKRDSDAAKLSGSNKQTSYADRVWQVSTAPKTFNGNHYYQIVVAPVDYTTNAQKELVALVRA